MVMREPVAREEHFYVGVDPGQSVDPTAIVIVHRITEGSGNWEPIGTSATNWREVPATRYELRWAERLPLRTSYPDAVRHIHELVETDPIRGRCTVCLDGTGVGAAVRDMFTAAAFDLVTITITSGAEPSYHGSGKWHVGKQDLVGCLEGALHDGSLKIARDLGEAKALADEFGAFRRTITGAGRATFGARTGKHDDLLLATSCALWYASRPKFRRRVLRVV